MFAKVTIKVIAEIAMEITIKLTTEIASGLGYYLQI